MFDRIPYYLLVLGAISALLFHNWRRDRSARANRKGLPLPPGPKPLPLFGNIRDIPTSHEWLGYTEWSKIYGDVVHFKVLTSDIIILNSLRATVDLFEKRSALYSDRPRMLMLNELIGWDWALSFMSYGSQWRRYRKTFHQQFTPSAIEVYRHVETEEVRRLLQRLLETPDDFRRHIRHLAGAIIMRVAYGIQVLDSEDTYISAAEDALHTLAEGAMLSSYLVNIMPILKHAPEWLPGAGFQAKARRWRKTVLDFVNKPFDAVKSSLALGTAQPSILASLLDGAKGSEEEEDVAKSIAAVVYAAGTDTTLASVQTMLFAMLLYPDAQRKAQAELDAVVGPDRLPEFSDQPSLPYVNAMIKEILRWLPVTPLAIAHRVTSDDEYDGYYIPKGAIVIGNSWAILHDERIYPDPYEFIPERFLQGARLNATVPDPEEVAAFGYGRRVCPGRPMATDTLFIALASVLACFSVEQALDARGDPVVVDREMAAGLVSYPISFRCAIKPRSARTAALIQQSLESGE